jgi:hypothetical protein
MGYCTNAEAIAEFNGLTVSASGTVVTTDLLTEWITQESNYIDGRIATRYTVPVTAGAAALSILKRICIFRVSQRIKSKTEVKSAVEQKDSESKYSKNYVETPNDDLDKIVKGLLLLKDAGEQSTEQGVSSFNVSQGVERKFCVTKQQW